MAKREISCKIIADSINKYGDRVTTFILIFPRFLLAELNTHRMLSRNSASSRARPFEQVLRDLQNDPFIPIKFLGEHRGMQGFKECEDPKAAREQWLKAKDNAIADAIAMSKLKITKQIVNRMLEPYLWHEVIVTATDYENFFALRADADAEIHIARLAEVMLEAYNQSKPRLLQPGEWHIPFGDNMDEERIKALVDDDRTHLSRAEDIQKKIATARCARLSYIPFKEEDKYDYKKDIELFENLLKSNHLSPFEHCAGCLTDLAYEAQLKYDNGYSGNFKGFMQYRKMFPGENRTDKRVIKIKPQQEVVIPCVIGCLCSNCKTKVLAKNEDQIVLKTTDDQDVTSQTDNKEHEIVLKNKKRTVSKITEETSSKKNKIQPVMRQIYGDDGIATNLNVWYTLKTVYRRPNKQRE